MALPSHSTGSFASLAAVIPVYQPDSSRLRRALELLAADCQHLFVVDNGGLAVVLDGWSSTPTGLEMLGTGTNLGVAAAQNLGIQRAREIGADAVVFLDQDSLPRPDMVRKLAKACGELRDAGHLVTACGPRYHEPGDGALSGFVRLSRFGLQISHPQPPDDLVQCAFLISSGMLVPSETLEKVGPMEEALFIDHVDTEWCFRAAAHGFACYGVGGAVMEHELGRTRKKIWLGRWRQVPDHSPERYFYLTRNTLWLARRPYMPAACKLHLLSRLLGLVSIRVLTPPNALATLKSFLCGVRAGMPRSAAL